jgi:thiol:disulfide interchange protein
MPPAWRARRRFLALGTGAALLVVAGALGFKLGPRAYNESRLRELAGTRVYDEASDGRIELASTLEQARRENRRVLVVLGGNWCQWCLALDDLMKKDREIEALLRERYGVLKLDGGAASALDASWGHPTRLGVPVLVFLDRAGSVAHVAETVPFEAWGGRLLSYDRHRVLATLQKWAAVPD